MSACRSVQIPYLTQLLLSLPAEFALDVPSSGKTLPRQGTLILTKLLPA